jgi:nicotinamidase-related amidase
MRKLKARSAKRSIKKQIEKHGDGYYNKDMDLRHRRETHMKNYFIVIDYQNDFITGALKNDDALAIKESIQHAISKYAAMGYKLIFTRDTHYDNYMETTEGKHLPVPHCIEGTEGWEVEESVRNLPECENAIFVNKTTFGKLDWQQYIEDDADEIVMCGVCTDICVVSNALILKNMYPCTEVSVLSDCCAGLTPQKHEHALDVMASCQVNVCTVK